MLRKPAKRGWGLAEFVPDRPRHLGGDVFQAVQLLVCQQADPPVVFRPQTLESRVRHAQSGVGDDGLQVVVVESLGVGIAQVVMGPKHPGEIPGYDPSVLRVVDLHRPIRIARLFLEKLA